MPPKPQVFKAKDGKEFATRAEWRDYMMATFFSWKNVVNAPEPLIRNPGDIDGQMYDIGDCEGSTLVIMDTCEQVQIDQVKNCRIFIGACASSIFIRNCENCVFYTCCRQLRLREVTQSTFYIYSMAEVHIEYSNTLKFAPFNGGYPEHAQHMAASKLDCSHNLWYDIFDHNDPEKTHVNWSLLPEAEYEEMWFPAGPCEPAVPRTKPGTVPRPDLASESGMQSFGVQQMQADAAKLNLATPAPGSPPKVPPIPQSSSSPAPSSPPKAAAPSSPSKAAPTSPSTASAGLSNEEKITALASSFFSTKGCDFLSSNFQCILPTSASLNASEVSLLGPESLWNIESINVSPSGTSAWAVFWVWSVDGKVCKTTAVFERASEAEDWKIAVIHKSAPAEGGVVAPPKTFN